MSNPPRSVAGRCPNGHTGPFPPGSLFCTQCGFLIDWGTPAAQPVGKPPGVPPPPDALPPAPAAAAPVPATPVAPPCRCQTCHDDPAQIPAEALLCPGCRLLRPLGPGYRLDAAAFQWSLDGSAMAKLRNIVPLNKAASMISDKVGRPWIEATFNAVRLGENQMPGVFRMAVLAARILALPHMPDVYVSGDRIWDAATYGSDRSSFIVLGTAIVGNFQGRELLFILAREMGHCRAGHALWKTVIRVVLGQTATRKGFAEAGLISALNPFQLLESTIELPLLAWARQAEITADRAGALAVGEAVVAQRALMTWSLKSAALLRKVSFNAWMEQLADDDEQVTRLSEVVSSSTPYITRRLKRMTEFLAKPEMERWGSVIRPLREAAWASVMPVVAGATVRGKARPGPARQPVAAPVPAKASGGMRVTCPACRKRLEIPRATAAGQDMLRVRCPHPGCGRMMAIQPKKREADDAQMPVDDGQ